MTGTDVDTTRGRSLRAIFAGVAALVAFALVPASALAAFSMSGLQSAPASHQAGAHSDYTIHVNFPDGSTNVKKLVVHLPPGVVGDPTATALCTVSQLNADNCPASSQVGSVTTGVSALGLLPLSVSGTLYNLTPQSGEPARFGIVLRPVGGLLGKIILQSAVKLRPNDYGLDTIIDDIPDSSNGLPTHIDSMNVVLQGLAGSPQKPFMRNPTSCSQATTTFDATDYNGATASGSASFTPTGCNVLDFSPTFSASIGSNGHTAAGTMPPLTTVVDQDSGEAGVKDVAVVLPQGLVANNAALGSQCSLASFQAGTCPANTVVGTATAHSPLLTQSLQGPVSILEPASAGSLPQLGLDLRGPLHIQLLGKFILTANGPGNEFDSIPDIPLSHFVLAFDAGNLVSTQRDLCAQPTPAFATNFTGWNGATQSGDVPVTVNGCKSGGGGGGLKANVRVTRAATHKPHLKLVVRESKGSAAKIKKTQLRLAHGIRFSGRDFTKGFTVKPAPRQVGATPHKVIVVMKGASKVVEKAGRGALLREHRIAGKKLHFKLKVTETGGKTTSLDLTTKAQP